MSQSLDMATALELTLDDEHEAKFVALKNLQTKKLKSLMSSIDAKDKEIAKLKILGKDNRRAQMIQELRKKIRTHETINDIIKEELQKRTETSIEDVNNLIIRKTLAGPKRFRPLSREELENKIIELEKKMNKKQVEPTGSSSAAHANRSVGSDAKSELSAQPKKSVTSAASGAVGVSADRVDEVGKFVSLVDELDDLRRVVRAKDAVLDAQKEEIIRLRSRNAQLIVVEEEAEYQERQYSELKAYNETLLGNLEDATKKLAEALDASMKLRAEMLLDNESRVAETDALHVQNEKYMRQNAQLLSTIAELEVERENHTTHVHATRQHTSTIESSVQEKDGIIRAWEEKYMRLEEKLRTTEKKVILLSKENTQIDELKEQLREKNIALKELRRNLEEKMRLQQQKSLLQLPTVAGGGGEGMGSDSSAPAVATAAVAEAKEGEHHNNNQSDHRGDKKGAK